MSADYVVSGFQHAEDGVNGGHAAGEDFGGGSAFQCGEICFEMIACRIGDAGVFVAFVFADSLLDVGRRWVDRNGDCSGEWIRLLTDVDGFGGEAGLFFAFHA